MLYAIVHKNRVVLGPLAWAQKYFTDVLKIRYRVSANIPSVAPESFPYKIDDNTEIYEVNEDRPHIDSMIQQYHGPHWDISQNPVVARYDIVDLDIKSARTNFKHKAAFERYKKEVSGTTITIQDTKVKLSTARNNVNVFTQKLLILQDGETCKWKFGEQWLELTKEDLVSIIKAITDHVQSAFDWEADIHNKLDGINVLKDLHNVEIVEKPELPQKKSEMNNADNQ